MSKRAPRYKTFQITKLTPFIGAEVAGVDLTADLTPQGISELKDAFAENLVLFFRDQRLSIEQHKNFARRFGEIQPHSAGGKNSLADHPDVLVVHADEKSTRVNGEEWHSDLTCDDEPPMGSLLYMHECPSEGGDTLFASMYAAYESLSDSMKRFVEDLTAVHDGASILRAHHGAPPEKSFRSEHPVVRTHPVTGRRALFVNRVFTSHIPQLETHESRALLEMLFKHIETPLFQCRFRWRPHSLAFWDNRCTQHQALFDYYPQRRHAHRVTVRGDRPVLKSMV